jgi:hypothetical protein
MTLGLARLARYSSFPLMALLAIFVFAFLQPKYRLTSSEKRLVSSEQMSSRVVDRKITPSGVVL